MSPRKSKAPSAALAIEKAEVPKKTAVAPHN